MFVSSINNGMQPAEKNKLKTEGNSQEVSKVYLGGGRKPSVVSTIAPQYDSLSDRLKKFADENTRYGIGLPVSPMWDGRTPIWQGPINPLGPSICPAGRGKCFPIPPYLGPSIPIRLKPGTDGSEVLKNKLKTEGNSQEVGEKKGLNTEKSQEVSTKKDLKPSLRDYKIMNASGIRPRHK